MFGKYLEFSPLPERGGVVQVDLSISFETVTEWGQPYITNAHTGRAVQENLQKKLSKNKIKIFNGHASSELVSLVGLL